MASEVILPRVDMDMAEGRIACWHVRNGDRVRKGQLLFDIETDKATMEVEADADGIIDGIDGELGVTIPVGQAVAWILGQGETLAAVAGQVAARRQAAPAGATAQAGAATPDAGTAVAERAQRAAPDSGALRASPLAKQLARELGVDLRALAAGLAGEPVRAKDVRAAQAARGAPDGDIGPLHLNWIARGTGDTVVFLHGFGADSGSWRPLASQLGGLTMAGVDLPNHGKSPAANVQSLAQIARAVLARLDAEQIGGVHLVAHSLGGGVAVALAPLLGDRLRSLTLLAPAGMGADINGEFIAALCRVTTEAAMRARLRELVADPRWITGSFVATALDQLQSPERRASLAAMAAALLPDGTQADWVLPLLGPLGVPCKVLWGSADRIIPAGHMQRMPAHVGRHHLDHVGHLPQVEATELVARLVREQVAAGSR